MSEVAGRLEVLVESSLRGFGKKLKAKVDEASKGIKAEIGVDLDAKGLRKKVQSVVDEAGKGLKVKIGIELKNGDVAKVRAELKALGKNAEVKVKVTADGSKLAAETEAEAAAVEKGARPSIGVRLRTTGRLVADVLKARAQAQAAAKANPIEIPVKTQKFNGRVLFRTLKFGAIAALVSVVEPAVGALGSLVTGLTAVAGAAAPAVGTLAAIPQVIGSVVQGALAGKVAFGGMGEAIKAVDEANQSLAAGQKLTAEEQDKLNKQLEALSPSARKAVKDLVGLKDGWMDVRRATQEAFFKNVAKDIKPVANVLLPLLKRGLSDTANVLGVNADKAAQFMQTSLFKRQFAGIMKQNVGTIDAGAGAIGNFAKGFLFFDRAAAPFQKRLDGVIRSTGEWFAKTMETNAANGDTERFLDRAGDKLKQLSSITGNLGKGLGGIFSAAAPSGDRLLASFDKFTDEWADWTRSTAGKNYLTDYFDKAEGNFRSMSKLINDTFKGLAKWAADPQIAGMVDQLRTQFGPALSKIFKTLGDNVAPHTIDLITQLATALGTIIGPASKIVGGATAGVAAVFKGINAAVKTVPGAAEAIGTLAGAFLVYKSATKGLKIIKSLGGVGKKGGLRNLFGGGSALGGGKGGVVPVYVTNMGAMGGGVDSKGRPTGGPGGPGVFYDSKGRPIKPSRGPGGPITVGPGLNEPKGRPRFFPGVTRPKVPKFQKPGFGGKGNLALFAATLGGGYVGSKVGGRGGRAISYGANGAGAGALAGSFFPGPGTAIGAGIGAAAGTTYGLFGPERRNKPGGKSFKDTFSSPQKRKDLTALAGTYRDLYASQETFRKSSNSRFGGVLAPDAKVNAQRLDKTANALYDSLDRNQKKFIAKGGVLPTQGLDAQQKRATEAASRALKKISAQRIAAARAERREAAANKASEAASQKGIPGFGGKKGGDFSVGVNAQSVAQTEAVVKRLGSSFKSLPKKVQTKISTPGSIKSRADVVELGKRFKLTPKQVKTIMKAEGFDKAANQAKKAGKAVTDAGKKRARPSATLQDKVSKVAKDLTGKIFNLGGKKAKPSASLQDNASKPIAGVVGKVAALGAKQAKPTASVNDQASGKLSSISGQLNAVDGRRATSVVTLITRKITEVGKRAIGVVKDIFGAKGGLMDTAAAGFIRRYADGGPVRGKGTGTSDSILARIANGEYVVPAKWAKVYRGILDKMRTGQYEPEDDDLDEYATGGPVRKKKKKKLSKAARRRQIRKLDNSLKDGLESEREFKTDKRIIRARFSGQTEKNLLKRLDRLWEIGKKQLKVQDKLEKAQSKLAGLREAKANIKSTLKQGGQEFGSLANIAGDNSGFLRPGFTIAELKRRAAEQKKFRDLLKQLQKKGLKKEGYEQIASLGAQEGLPLAQQLAQATPAQIKQINQLQAQITKTATNTGKDAAKAYYNAGIKAAAGLVKGLKSQTKALEKVAEGIGKSMVKGIKKALKIKSPSRVMYGLGVFSGKGLTNGLKSQQKHVAKRARNIADEMRKNMTVEQARAPRVTVAQMRRNAMLSNGTMTQPGVVNHNAAPLVGSVDMRGMDPRAAHDNLSELMFQLRVLKAGGVHADRVA